MLFIVLFECAAVPPGKEMQNREKKGEETRRISWLGVENGFEKGLEWVMILGQFEEDLLIGDKEGEIERSKREEEIGDEGGGMG